MHISLKFKNLIDVIVAESCATVLYLQTEYLQNKKNFDDFS